jgi:hypothetical protein
MGLAAHPMGHAFQVQGMEIRHHREVDVIRFKLMLNLLVHSITHSFSNHGYPPYNMVIGNGTNLAHLKKGGKLELVNSFNFLCTNI